MSIFKKSVKNMLAEASTRTNQFWNKYASDYQDEYSAGTNYWLKGSLFDKKESMFKDEYGFKEDKYDFFALAQYQRAVANFVHIMTGDSNIHVQYNNNGHNMTDGKTVHLSASINEKDFDSNVGLALHESSHILYTDMNKFRDAVSNLVYYPHNFLKDENGDLIFSSAEEVEKIFTLGAYSDKRDFFKSIVNIIEDLYIDAMTYTAAPGYRIYYKSLYNKFFGDEKVTRGFYDEEFMKPTSHNYLFHLCNFRSPYRNLNALPALQLVWDKLDLQNIRRLKTDEDRINLAYTVAGIITKQLSKELQKNEPEQEPDNQDGDGNNKDYDYEPPVDNPGPQIPDGVSDKPLTDKQIEQIQKLFQKQKDLINGDTKKTKLSKSDAQKVDAVSSVNLDEQIVARNFEDDYGKFNPRGIKTFIVRNINRKFMESDVSAPFGIRKAGWRRRDISRYIALGKVLAKKLQIRNEERVTTSTRLKSGRIDARLLHEIGSNNYEIFKQITIHEYQPSYIHLSIDQSGSMSGDKFEESVKLAVMFAVAAKQIKNLHVVISARSVYADHFGRHRGKSTMHDTPYLVYLYDSNKHNIAHIRDVFETIYTTNTTPEGLCFEAIMGEILKQSANTDAYFINLCDGQPYMTNDKQHFVYRGVTAQTHSRKQVERMRARGINVLTYFIGHASDFRDVIDTYKTNCVHLRRADEIPKVVKAMNDELLSTAKKNG
jgi:hypothetical protein